MLRIVIELEGTSKDAQGVKEKLAMDMERYGDVRIAEVYEIKSEQLKIEETYSKSVPK